jgi:hypothetical protein
MIIPLSSLGINPEGVIGTRKRNTSKLKTNNSNPFFLAKKPKILHI